MTRLWAARAAIALVWLYNGLWCKLLHGCPSHAQIVASIPGLDPRAAMVLVWVLGALEVALAAWVLSGLSSRAAAAVQTTLLVGMNLGGIVFAAERIPDVGAMLVQNIAFLTLIWLAPDPDGHA